jgi:UDP:flavonoid glycosyltransferase YjiC (YdhE family)
LTEAQLAEAIAKVLETPRYRQAAGQFAERLQAHDAVGAACERIEAYLTDAS